MDNLDITEVKQCVPKNIRANITDELVQTINDIIADPDMAQQYRENFIGYMDVLREGKWKFSDYIHAVKYVSYKLRGDSNIAAYTKTFPDRVRDYQARGVTDYSPWVVSYNKSKLVNEIMGRSLIPTHVLNADIHQEAINVQAAIMRDPTVTPKVRSEAANSLLTHLKQPETSKIEIDMNVKEDSAIADLRATTAELVKQQRQMIESGSMTAKDAAHQVLIVDAEYSED